MRVTLEPNGNEGSWLQIQPCYKHRTLNDAVFISDKVNLHSVDAAQSIHTSAERLHDNPGCTEVNVAPGSHSWKIFLYFEYHEAADEFLKVREEASLLSSPRRSKRRPTLSCRYPGAPHRAHGSFAPPPSPFLFSSSLPGRRRGAHVSCRRGQVSYGRFARQRG